MANSDAGSIAGAVTKTDAAYARLRAGIESGRYADGERLLIGRLEEELGMSPTPIREALRLLQADGLVEHRAHHGMVVSGYSREDVEDVYRLRSVLEPVATEIAAEHATDAQLAHLRELHRKHLEALAADAPGADAVRFNVAWHNAIYEASGSRRLQEFIGRLWSAVPAQAMWRSTRARQAAQEHEAIMRALERRDGAAAAELMRKHIDRGRGAGMRVAADGGASPNARKPRRTSRSKSA